MGIRAGRSIASLSSVEVIKEKIFFAAMGSSTVLFHSGALSHSTSAQRLSAQCYFHANWSNDDVPSLRDSVFSIIGRPPVVRIIPGNTPVTPCPP